MYNFEYKNKIRRVVGLMSGTSVDGIDAALIEIKGDPFDGDIRLLAFNNKPFPKKIKSKIFQLFDVEKATLDKVAYMNVLLGELYAKAVLSVIEKAGLKETDVDLIGSHGQTIYHHPPMDNKNTYPMGYTVQIGEGAIIAQRTNIPCLSDFRVADMAVGGQGAPLVPFTDYLLYRDNHKTRLLQNIGGIGNITILPKGSSIDEVYAFDTGPGNMIIDGLLSRFTNNRKTMDEGGAIAAKGKVNHKLLSSLQDNDYFQKIPPKSTGREMFGDKFIDKLYKELINASISFEDAIATATDFTAWSIEDSYLRYILPKNPASELILAGGGSYNTTLVSMIRQRMSKYNIQTLIQEDLGFNSDAKEAIAFAILADCAMAGIPNNIPNVTGASRPVIMGKVSLCKRGRDCNL